MLIENLPISPEFPQPLVRSRPWNGIEQFPETKTGNFITDQF